VPEPHTSPISRPLPMALYLTVFLAVLNQIGMKGSKMLVALYAISMGASPLAIGFLIAMYSLFPIVVALYAGRVTDRIGVRWPMVVGSLVMVIGLMLPPVFPVLASLYLSATLIGVGNIFYHVACLNLIGSLGEPHQRTAHFGTFSLGGAVSGMLGPVMAGLLVDSAGYSITYVVLAAIVTLSALVMLFYTDFIPAHVKVAKEAKAGSVREMIANKPLRNVLITSGLILTGMELFNFYMPIYGHSIGLQASVIGIIISMQAAAAFVVRIWMPALARRFGEEPVLKASLIVAGATYFMFPLFQNPVMLAAMAFLLGLGLGCGQPLSTILTYNYALPGRVGEALGLRLAVNKVTQLAVPLAFGTLGTAFGIVPIFWCNAGLLLAGSYLMSGRKQSLAARKETPHK